MVTTVPTTQVAESLMRDLCNELSPVSQLIWRGKMGMESEFIGAGVLDHSGLSLGLSMYEIKMCKIKA